MLLGALALVSLGFHPTFDLTSGNTGSTQSAQFGTVLLKGFPAGDSEPTSVLVQSTNGKPLDAASLSSFGARLAKVGGVASVSPVEVNAGRQVADYTVILTSAGESGAAMNTVRGPLQAVANTAPAGSRALIGGITSVYVDLDRAMTHDYSIVFPVAAALILLILGLLLQSVVAPWYLMAFVGLGFAATLGTSVGVFQDLDGQSGLTFVLPIMMGFAVSCGIAIAAFVMAMFLTPAVTALLGARAWWPGRRNPAGHGGQPTGGDLRSDPDATQWARA